MTFQQSFLIFIFGLILGLILAVSDRIANHLERVRALRELGQLPDLKAVNKSISQMYQSKIPEFRTIATIIDGEEYRVQKILVAVINLLSKAHL